MRQGSRRAVVILVAALLWVQPGCGASFVDGANKTLATALSATNAARDQFTVWDRAHQLEIVNGAASRADAEVALNKYRAKRAKVIRAFTVAYVSIGTAVALIPLVERGIKKESALLPLLADVATAIAAVKEAYAALKGD